MPKKNRVRYLGEETGDNMQVTPDQLLDMIRSELLEPGAGPVKGLYAVLIREDDGGTLHLDTFRAQLPKFTEIAVVTRQFWRLASGDAP